jgi:hypothetical protein
MRAIYFIDGFGGSPKINWLDAEASKLQSSFSVKKVDIAQPTTANVNQWDEDLKSGITDAENSYFVCHSLGCISFLRYLLHEEVIPKGCILVSPFQQSVEQFPEFEEYFNDVELSTLSKLLTKSLVISAENDPIIPWKYSHRVASELRIPFLLLPEGKHFRSMDGMVEFQKITDFALENWLND